MKMANMDAVLGFMFTDPKDPNGVRSVASLSCTSCIFEKIMSGVEG